MARKILVIDDEVNFAQVMKINLEHAGPYEVDTALNANEGLEKILGEKYDIIFLDLIMPKIEGHEALSKIKKITGAPIVVISAYLPVQKKSSIIQAGAFACLEKPVELNLLLQTLKTIEQNLALKEQYEASKKKPVSENPQ